jgi:hypothetical protein
MSGSININTYKSNMSNNKISKNNKSGGIFDFILRNEMLFIGIAFFAMIIISVIVAGMYQNVPEERQNVAFNQINLILLSLVFIYVIFTFMGQNIIIFGESFDMGMILYVAIVMFIMFILGG